MRWAWLVRVSVVGELCERATRPPPPPDDGQRAERLTAYEFGLASLKEALSDLLAQLDPAVRDPSGWRGLVVQFVVVLPAHCGRHAWTSERSRVTAKSGLRGHVTVT